MKTKFEILTFKDGDFSLPVNVSPSERTLWLTASEMALLFDTTSRNVRLHISNILKEKELDNSAGKKSFLTAADGKNYETMIYNLEMVLSVGYRVKSKRGNIFRRWATRILDEYLFNKNDCLECKEKIIDLQNQIIEIKEKQLHELTFEKGEQFEGYLSIKKFLETAKQSIYIIDDYFNHSFDEVLKKINVSTTIITDPNNELENNEIYTVKKTKAFHDRFIFVDGVGYHLGCSLKDIGNSLAIATRLESIKLSDLLKLIK